MMSIFLDLDDVIFFLSQIPIVIVRNLKKRLNLALISDHLHGDMKSVFVDQ